MATIMNASAVRSAGATQKQQRATVSAKTSHMMGRPVVAKALRKGESVAVSAKAARNGQVMQAATRGKVATRAVKTVAAVATEAEEGSVEMMERSDIRNVAIIAHVDHGKTTLVDSMLAQSKIFRDNEQVQQRIMDSNDLERERGITILAKNTAVRYKGNKVNIIDTPGHADFGGEVERVLNMVDGVLLLVDSVEGPMPQTRFVLKKALELGKKVVVVVNKIDRPGARPDYVLDTTFDLFVELGATDEQCEFPVVYASGLSGIAGPEPDQLEETLEPLFDVIMSEVPGPVAATDAPLQMLITNLDYDEHKGRIALGRITAGKVTNKMSVQVGIPGEAARTARVGEVFVYDNFVRTNVDEVEAGDICAFAGITDIKIGETVMTTGAVPLPTIEVEEPTVRMTFSVNTSPFAGKEGKFVTSRNIRDRLMKELERNLALKVEDGETSDMFVVSGRGALHITILIENMRREGFEFTIGPPTVIMKEGENGERLEPYEFATVEVGEDYTGSVVDLLSSRKGQMLDMNMCDSAGQCTVKYKIPTRGLIGLRNSILTATRGTGILNTIFAEYGEYAGDINSRDNGSLIAFETGQVTSYALFSAQERGQMMVGPGVDVYEGQVIGIHQRPGDLKVNIVKRKAATNVRSNKDATVVLNQSKDMSLDDCVEYIAQDELVEVTPESVRILKNTKMGKQGWKSGGKK
uniref:Tr-type G domain-containing protein n=1 Tax=Pyramimonas obovata TaxID=1411642 RepID=A0A7S0QZL3_9CHLO|mmetsp:Transcript_22769/g.49910  ORF Transcript_22769/g.49910 Transcript_22769/m.49910 type:complete len:695 (+) Transcript_22769:75-2159(+)|eukprot:CAMPEP_0118924180 /NCGR_PEP_ID=MMETSP1169-20130426/2431_1 /TAXON_ID=36882 /ORGANISM="Pyramimonas obovata, Strain CCMP722" /LENGTH=694 /DNA_ID=CAMNT_0006865269 /DNA_START=60 /DNA_END=2144 /DNA_ORIENTATION=+